MLVAGRGVAQKESQGYWMNILSYGHYNVASNFKVFNGGIITPGKWIGLGLSIGDLYSTGEQYQVFNGDEGLNAHYGMLSLVTPSIHLIPLAKQTDYFAFDGRVINLLHLYLSYSPWAAVSLSNKQTEDIPVQVFGSSRIFDVGIAYTFSFMSLLPMSIKMGYMNMSNKKGDVFAYHFPSNRGNYFYYGLNISLGSWNKGGLNVKESYTFSPFIANSGKMLKQKRKGNRDWNGVRAEKSAGMVESVAGNQPESSSTRIAGESSENNIKTKMDRPAGSTTGISGY
jgi:hypothetical protein